MCDEEIFEINDFSTSSDWERFISDLEEILTHWNLNHQSNSSGLDSSNYESPIKNPTPVIIKSLSKLFSDPKRWQQKQESIKFGKVSFQLQYFGFKKDSTQSDSLEGLSENSKTVKQPEKLNQAWVDMNSIENDWPATGHPLVRYYGLSQFLVLSPLNGETISTEDRARHLIGSAAIALHNLDCEVPFFCQISALSRKLFMGVGHQTNGFRTYFEMIQLPEVPPSYFYLNELMVLFKKKLYSSFSYGSNIIAREEEENKGFSNESIIPKIQISIRFTYILTKWPTEYLIFNQTNRMKSFLGEKFTFLQQRSDSMIIKPIANLDALFGDPLTQMQLATTWPSVAEELITDNAYHSDLQPRNAPRWSLRALFTDNNFKTYCPTVELLRTFLSLQHHRRNQLLAYLAKPEDDNNQLRSALDRLSSPTTPTAKKLTSTTSQLITSMSNLVSSGSNQIPLEFIETIVRSLFEKSASENEEGMDPIGQLKNLKSSPIDSLSWRIGCLCLNIYGQTKQITSFAQLWKCLINQLRAHWESGRLLPYLIGNENENLDSKIDYSSCIFHQKLQMLNCCIQQKIKREHQFEDQARFSEEEAESDDEFYDAADELVNQEKSEGQLYPLKDPQTGNPLYLLSDSSQQIQVPLTQDPAPMTEDALAKQVSNLSQIEDSKIKIRLQSAGLLSDMEAFKAANPGCQFEDFIRWHSPRDWTETTNDSDGRMEFGLSRRMRESNTWIELWELAKPVPVRRQKRLFNYTKEAEEILRYFETISIQDFIQMLNPVIFKAVISRLIKYRQEIIDFCQENIQNDNQKSSHLKQIFKLDISMIEHHFAQSDFTNLLEQLFEMEYEIVKFYSLTRKFERGYEIYFRGKNSFSDIFNNSVKSENTTNNGPNKTKTVKQHSRFKAMHKNPNDFELNPDNFLKFILGLMSEPEVEFSNTNLMAQLIVQIFYDSDRFNYEQTTSVGERLSHHFPDRDDSFDGDSDSQARYSQRFTTSTLPAPTGKEFIIRAQSIQRPAPYSRPSSNRMYCLLSKDFRIATAFSEDTAYF